MKIWTPDVEFKLTGWPAVFVGAMLIVQAIDGLCWLILKLMGWS